MTNKSRERLIVEALERIFGRTVKAVISDGVILHWLEPSEVQPSKDQLDAVIIQIIAEEPAELLRRKRDELLMECDWRVAPDYPHADQQAWVVYRQSLRDLPQNIEDGMFPRPTLSESGELLFDHWPVQPS